MMSVLARRAQMSALTGQRGFAVLAVDSVEQFTTAVKDSDKAVAYFTASWCGPCRAIAPHIDELAAGAEDVSILKVDIDQHEALAAKYQIRAVPTFKFLQGGEVVDEVQGADVNGIDAALGRLQER